jgi:hypothetical protein
MVVTLWTTLWTSECSFDSRRSGLTPRSGPRLDFAAVSDAICTVARGVSSSAQRRSYFGRRSTDGGPTCHCWEPLAHNCFYFYSVKCPYSTLFMKHHFNLYIWIGQQNSEIVARNLKPPNENKHYLCMAIPTNIETIRFSCSDPHHKN